MGGPPDFPGHILWTAMERMQLSVLAVRRRGNRVIAYVRADSERAQIHIRLFFDASECEPRSRLWERSYEEALRYLDLA